MLFKRAARSISGHFLPLTIIFFLIHLPFLGTFSLSVDDELAAIRDDPSIWIAQGRYTTYLIEQMWLAQSSVMYFPVLIFGIGLVLSYILLIEAHDIYLDKPMIYLTFAFFCAYPTWFLVMEFYSNLPSVGLGAILSAFSVWTFSIFVKETKELHARRQFGLILSSVLSLAIAIGAYQSFLLFASSAFAGVILMKELSDDHYLKRSLVKSICVALGIIIFSTILYYLTWKFFLYILNIDVLYINEFFNISALWSSLGVIFGSVATEAFKIYTGHSDVYGIRSSVFGLIPLAALATVLYHSFYRGFYSALFIVILFIITISVPFGLHFFAQGVMPYRSVISVPYVMLLSIIIATNLPRAKLYVTVLAIAATGQSLYVISLFHTGNSLVLASDQHLARDIYGRVMALKSGSDSTEKVSVLFVGNVPYRNLYPSVVSSAIGRSFFEWDEGNPGRMIAFMEVLGLNGIRAANAADFSNFALEYITMPIWPDPDSVRRIGNTVVVRLSEEPSRITQPGLIETIRRQAFALPEENLLYEMTTGGRVGDGLVINSEYEAGSHSLQIKAVSDPQIYVDLRDAIASQCEIVQLTIDQEIENPDVLQVFFIREGEAGFSEQFSRVVPQTGGFNHTSLFLSSSVGFESSLRVDPGGGTQNYDIKNIQVGCLKFLGS